MKEEHKRIVKMVNDSIYDDVFKQSHNNIYPVSVRDQIRDILYNPMFDMFELGITISLEGEMNWKTKHTHI